MSDSEIQELLQKVSSNKRARTMLEHILKHGQVTTDEMKTLYGYNHPPRAASDLKDLGIPLQKTRVVGPDGRRIMAYTLGDLDDVDAGKQGRRALPKALRAALAERDGTTCALCAAVFPLRALQIDHRVPFRIVGDVDTREQLDPARFMLLCGPCNRAKSWSCEQCPNWTARDPSVCGSCFWAGDPNYSHIATSARRQLTLNWSDEEVHAFDQLRSEAAQSGMSLETLVKILLEKGRMSP